MIKRSNTAIAAFVGVLIVLKIGLDAAYAMHGNTNNVYDILDIKDTAKQFFYTHEYLAKRHFLLASGDGVRSPFQSVLIALGSAVVGINRLDAAVYLVATMALGLLVWSLLTAKSEIWRLSGRPARADSDALLLGLLLFNPLTVGLSRSSLIELPLAACIYGVLAGCLACTRDPRLSRAIWLNLLFSAGTLWDGTFPLYVGLPILATAVMALRHRRGWLVILASILFQLMVQRAWAYNLVNARTIVAHAFAPAKISVRYPDGLAHDLLVRVLGLPVILALAIFIGMAVLRAVRRVGREDRLVPWTADGEISPRWTPPRVVLTLGALNLLLVLAMQVSGQSQYLRFYYFAVPAAFLAAVYLGEAVIPPRFWWAGAGPVALAGVAVTALYSIPMTHGWCDRPIYKLALAQSCGRIEPVDGSAYSPVGGSNPIPLALAALQAHGVRHDGAWLLVGPNPYNNIQAFAYKMRDPRDGWGVRFQVIGRLDMDKAQAYPAAADAAILVEPSNRVFERVSGNGFMDPDLRPDQATLLLRSAKARLAALGLSPVTRIPNPTGDLDIYVRPPAR